MLDQLRIIHWPDPRLTRASDPVTVFDDQLSALADRMLQLMRQARGVGLAAPQVGVNLRLFVMNATGESGDDRVYANPAFSDAEGSQECEEGCLSLPGINTKVMRAQRLRLSARDAQGRPVEATGDGLVARIWQHEFDHLNGVLLIDHMGPVSRLANRKKFRELKADFEKEQDVARKVAPRAPVPI
jgi:peptide deformylase